MPRASRKRRIFQLEDEPIEEPAADSTLPAAAQTPPPLVQTPARVFRRPAPATPATTQQTSNSRRVEVFRCDPHIPVNTSTGQPGTGMFLMLLAAWTDKAAFDLGIKEFLMKGDFLKFVAAPNDARGKGHAIRVISPIHVRACHFNA